MSLPAASGPTLRTDLLDPAEVASLGGVEFVTHSIVDGFVTGQHRSARRGYSIEFAEHRGYQPGDEPRHIDWKLLGRTDRLFVKQYEEETNLRAMLVLDRSASMGWSGSPERLTKLEYSVRLAAAIALLMQRQRDAVGLVSFDHDLGEVIPPRLRAGHWHLLARRLGALRPGTGTAAEPALRQVVRVLRRRGMVIFLSDLLLDRELTLTALRWLRHRGHEVMVLHLADPDELQLAPGEESRYLDPETGRSVTLSPADWAEAYQATVKQAIHTWKVECGRRGIRYALIRTDQPFGTALRRVLSK